MFEKPLRVDGDASQQQDAEEGEVHQAKDQEAMKRRRAPACRCRSTRRTEGKREPEHHLNASGPEVVRLSRVLLDNADAISGTAVAAEVGREYEHEPGRTVRCLIRAADVWLAAYAGISHRQRVESYRPMPAALRFPRPIAARCYERHCLRFLSLR